MKLRLLASAALLCLACTNSTGLSLDGPSFIRARVDGHFFSVEEGHVLSWGWVGYPGTFLSLNGQRTAAPDSNAYIYFQIGAFNGPGTYTLDGTTNTIPAQNAALYGLFDGNVSPTREFETGGQYTGSITISAMDSTTIVGTFTFSAGATLGPAGDVHLTHGSFRVSH